MSIYAINLQTIDEKPATLAEYKGKVLLIVNVASECGYTPQYKALEELHQKYAGRGFAVLGFPSNDFGAQEPGTNSAIKEFCTTKFNVSFPMYAKIPVKGPEQHLLYKHLTENAATSGEVQWNFEKFLLGPEGAVVGRYLSDVEPGSAKLAGEIEKVLG
jgi:glutathione peroxidase